MLGGQSKKKEADSKSTGLTGAKIGLTGASSEFGNSSKTKNRTRPSFKELLAKYEKEGAAQKQKGRPNKVKDTKLSLRHQEQSDSRTSQANYAPFSEPIAP